MKKLLLILCIFLMFGCSSNRFSTYYNDEGLYDTDFISLKSGENVKIIETTNFDKKLQEYKKQGYVLLGTAEFDSEWEPFSKAISTAKEKGATLVILETSRIGRHTKQYTMAIPQTNTVYHNGSANSYQSGYIGATGYSGNSYTNYSGTSTYTSTNYINGSYDVTQFHQNALFLAKSNDDLGDN